MLSFQSITHRIIKKKLRPQHCTLRAFHFQSGTSMSEAVIFLLVMIPLCTLIPTFAKVAHFKMQLPQISRYLGWHQAMTQDSLESKALENHTRERILKLNTMALQTQQQDSSRQNQHPFWSGQSKKIYDAANLEHTRITRHSASSGIKTTTKLISGVTKGLSAISKGNFTFNTAGISHHAINITLDTHGLIQRSNCNLESTNNSTLCLTQRHTIFSHSLAARSAQEITSQVNSLKPFSSINPIANTLASIASRSWIFKEGATFKNAPLHVNTEALPQDRLKRR